MTMFEAEHSVQVFRDAWSDLQTPHNYWAECSCGWESEYVDTEAEAEAAAADHGEVTDRPGEGFDRFMSGLLDLQDDLAAASLWLAEHWSADMPLPRWYGNGDDDGERPPVRVIVYCNRAELARAAELLDVPEVDDPAPDGHGNRYRRAIRRFGRVEVEAYTSLPTTCDECGTDFHGVSCPQCGQAADAARSLVLASELAPPEAGVV